MKFDLSTKEGKDNALKYLERQEGIVRIDQRTGDWDVLNKFYRAMLSEASKNSGNSVGAMGDIMKGMLDIPMVEVGDKFSFRSCANMGDVEMFEYVEGCRRILNQEYMLGINPPSIYAKPEYQ